MVVLAPSRMFVREHVHVEVELAIASQNLLGMRQQHLARVGERDAVVVAVEKPYAILLLYLLYVLADGGLRYKQLVRRFGKAEVAGYAAKNFQPEIYHGICILLGGGSYRFHISHAASACPYSICMPLLTVAPCRAASFMNVVSEGLYMAS